MKNKLKLLGLITGLTLAPLTSCNLITVPPLDENAILADETVEGYTALGPSTHHVGDQYFAEWQNNFDKKSCQVMSATSVSDVRSYDNNLANYIVEKGVQALYTLKNVSVADTKRTGWKTTWGPDKKEVDGHFCMKFGTYLTDPEMGATIIDSWIPDQRTCKVLSLTPETYWVSPNFSEVDDENGYNWTDNPVITKAGVYNLTLVKFKAPIDGALFGVGATLLEEKPEAQPPKLKCWRMIGTFDNWDVNNPIYTFDSNNQCTLDLTSGDEFKVAKFLDNNTTDYSGSFYTPHVAIGKELIASSDYSENIKLLESGNYTITLHFDEINGNTLDIVKNY